MKNIEEIFGFGKLQELVTLRAELKKRDLSFDDAEKYIQAKKKEMAKASKGKKMPQRKCPECSTSPMRLMPLNTGPRDQTGDESRSVWYCPVCHREEFSEKTVHEQVRTLMKGGR